MKKKISVNFLVLFILLFLVFSTISYSQFGLDKLKKTGEQVKGTEKAQECEALEKLKTRFKLLKDMLDNKDYSESFWKMHMGYAKDYIQEIKKDCPKVDIKPLEDELAGYEKRYVEEKSASEKSAQSKDDASKVVRESGEKARTIMYNILDAYYVGKFCKKEPAEEFFKFCKDLDYSNRKSKIKEIVSSYPEFTQEGNENKSNYDDFMTKLPQKLEEMITNTFTNDINKAIEDAYSKKAAGKSQMGQALESAEAGLITTNALLLVFPNNTSLQDLQKEAQTAVDKISSELGAAIYTSNFHKENAGKIVFSKSPVEIKKENPGAMLNKFVAGDFIYGMMYLKGTFKELTQGGYKVSMKIFVDGNEKVSRDFEIPREKWEWTYLSTEIVADPKISQTKGTIQYAKALSELSPRKHKIKVQFVGEYGDRNILSEGEFELDCSEGLDKLVKIAKDLENKELSQVFMSKPEMKNAQLEKEMLAALSDWKEKPLRVVILDNDWTAHRNAISGAIENRTIQTEVAFKTPEGDCKIFWLSFKQDYDGKKYGKTKQWGVGDNKIIPCENVNK
jgi:hypothetical protein